MPRIKQSKTVQIPLQTVQRLFETGSALANLAEELLEAKGAYNKKFLDSLDSADQDVRAGRIRKVESVDDILPKQ